MEFGLNLIKSTGSDWLVISGDDGSFLDLVVQGGHGVISVLSHIIPKKVSDLTRKAMSGDASVVRDRMSLSPLIDALYVESNPIPVKMALYKMGVISSPELRLPMTVATPETTKIFAEAFKGIGVYL